MQIQNSNGFEVNTSRPSKNRITYIDPNDIYGNINGATVTPDYTDYCIWCNLIVERNSRIKSGIEGSSSDGRYSIAWDAVKSQGLTYDSFMHGYSGDYNYLTTDYTEIDFSTIKERTMIEGLGIESISINMSNYAVPEITINFIDVRGSGFFGREEATHDTFDLISLDKDKHGEIIDNFYNCFVSFPYPRFKLQVKGFYGDAVTYQLTCSSFTGTFDNDTGNFKLTAKFIGYQYSILGDIPFEYILAAPYCQYKNAGAAYWDAHVGSKEWRLANGERPIKLLDCFRNISSAIQGSPDSRLSSVCRTGDEETIINECEKLSVDLGLLLNRVNAFKSEMSDLFGSEYVISTNNSTNDKSEQVIYLSNSNTVQLSDGVCTKYNELVDAIDLYFRNHPGGPSGKKSGRMIDTSCRPNRGEKTWEPGEINMTELFSYDSNIVSVIGDCINNTEYGNVEGSIDDIKANGISVACVGTKGTSGSETISMELSVKINEYFNSDNVPAMRNNCKYACIIDYSNISIIINELIGDAEAEKKVQTDSINDINKKEIIDVVGFSPYIGNFFKVVMCHLETFINLIYTVAENIDIQTANNMRTPAKLGVSYSNTDVKPSIGNIPPWPNVYKTNVDRYNTTSADTHVEARAWNNNFDEDVMAKAWVGDFKGTTTWEEQEFIEAFYLALYAVTQARVDKDVEGNYSGIVNNTIPIIPSDLLNHIPAFAYTSKEYLSAYLGMRMCQIFCMYHRNNGVSDDTAEKIGSLDAYNFYNNSDSVILVDRLVKSSGEGDSLSQELYNYMLPRNDARDQHYEYEFTSTVNGQQPIFTENGENLTYQFMNSKDGFPLLPINESDLSVSTINRDYEWTGDDSKHTFKSKSIDSDGVHLSKGNTQHLQNTNSFLSDMDGDDTMVKEYINQNMFTIITDRYDIDKIAKIHNVITNGDNDGTWTMQQVIKERSKYVDIANNYWSDIECENEYYEKNKNKIDEYKTYDEAGINSNLLISDNGTVSDTLVEYYSDNKRMNELINKFKDIK